MATLAAIGPVPVHGARHDSYAFEASGLKAALENSTEPDGTAADLGYIGVDGIAIAPFRERVGGTELHDCIKKQRKFNASFSRDPFHYRARRREGEVLADAERGRRPVPMPNW